MTDQGGIHEEHPFVVPPEQRDPVRQFWGRLGAPVAIVTSGEEGHGVGLTVSSMMVAEGTPPFLYFLVGGTTELFYAMDTTGKFVVHVCESSHRARAEAFAGQRPAPGGPFTGLPVRHTPWGPVIEDMGSRVFCSVADMDEDSYSIIVEATIDELELSDVEDPLLYFRGAYRRLE
jgi:flavin reductase (DIM6/NTAB) family NADH-FMN oxidoreductase RutF